LIDWLETDLPTFFHWAHPPYRWRSSRPLGPLGRHSRRPLPAIDSLLAATALKHDLVFVTRDVKDFAGLPVQIFNRWTT
jgi:hypothetical protein